MLKSLFKNARGSVTPEMAAILAMVLTIAVGAMVYIAPKIRGVFESIGSKL